MNDLDIPGFDYERCTCIPREKSKGLTCGIDNGNSYLIPCERWIESEELCKIAESVSKRFEMKKGNRIRYVVGVGLYIGKVKKHWVYHSLSLQKGCISSSACGELLKWNREGSPSPSRGAAFTGLHVLTGVKAYGIHLPLVLKWESTSLLRI
jgi:hypothetical protein